MKALIYGLSINGKDSQTNSPESIQKHSTEFDIHFSHLLTIEKCAVLRCFSLNC